MLTYRVEAKRECSRTPRFVQEKKSEENDFMQAKLFKKCLLRYTAIKVCVNQKGVL